MGLNMEKQIQARVTMFIQAPPEDVYAAFVEPQRLTQFWLSKASGSLHIGKTVRWSFMVEGAEVDTLATKMDEGKTLAFDWGDKRKISFDFESLDRGTAVTDWRCMLHQQTPRSLKHA
jgi:uncharacterized protein YndB with AHSA1/START domain